MLASQLDFEDLQLRLLQALDHGSIQDTRRLQLVDGEQEIGADADEQAALKSALDSLAGKGMLSYKIHSTEVWHLSEEGLAVARDGSPEFRAWQACAGAGSSIPQLQVGVCLQWCCLLQVRLSKHWAPIPHDWVKQTPSNASGFRRRATCWCRWYVVTRSF
jgi:hypothetical protein